MTDFTYQPLDSLRSFRFIEVQLGAKEDPVECRLLHSHLDLQPSYEAISYAWGDATIRQDIVCNGHQLSITTSLHGALQWVRQEDRVRVVWADAIAINQSDDEERASQVVLMYDIYANCQRVLAWLGPEGDDSDKAVIFIREAAKQICAKSESKSISELYYEGNNVPSLDLAILPDAQDPCWRAVGALYARSYFCRLWIIQEVSAAPEVLVVCGHQELSYEELGVCGLWITESDNPDDLEIRRRLVFPITSAYQASHLRLHVSFDELDLLNFGRDFDCSDPRDHFYGFLALATFRESSITIRPNYTVTADAVFLELAEQLLTPYGLEVLDYVCHVDSFPANIPSWVPRWATPREINFALAATAGVAEDTIFEVVPQKSNL